MIGIRNIICTFIKNKPKNLARLISTVSEEINRQSELFDLEQKRQTASVGRIEKIEVHYEGVPENATLVMNKNLSTPYDCAKHIGEMLMNRSAVALLNGTTVWHMHKPIPDSCKLELLHFKDAQPAPVNKAFWRTCSFLLGAVANEAFKENVNIKLHSFPSPNIKTGSFVYDIQLSLDNWAPTQSELKVLSIEMIKMCREGYNIYCLDVNPKFAEEMFKHNPHKTKQIPDIARNNAGKITLFKVGNHIDISKGPMISNTNQIGRVTVANVTKLNTDIPGDPIYRFQGVALPSCIVLNHYAYNILEERAVKLNPARIPCQQGFTSDDQNLIAEVAV